MAREQTLDKKLRSLIMSYVTGQMEEKQFLKAYRRLLRIQSILSQQ